MAQVLYRAHGVRADDSVSRQSAVALELTDRALGEASEDRVEWATREPERAERLLENAHIATVEVREAEVEHPIAEGECLIYEC